MTDGFFQGITPSREAPAEIDTGVAHPARVYNYWLGGKDNFAADRAAAEEVIAVRPGITADIRANRAWLGRAVRFLAGEAGIRQFLDIGTGIPTGNNTHDVAQSLVPAARIVYVDNDPIVLAHARALLTSSPAGRTAYLNADLREPGTILPDAARTLEFGQPIAVMLAGVLHLIPDAASPAGIITRLMDAMPPGSYLALSHPASDVHPDVMAQSARAYNAHVVTPQTRRTRAEVTRFFAGLELVPPGVVQQHLWRPDLGNGDEGSDVAGYGGVARKPD
jgi:trans-aconitate methyltransferase